jgi:hypothetical protein
MRKALFDGVARTPSESVSNSFKQALLEKIAKRALAVFFHSDNSSMTSYAMLITHGRNLHLVPRAVICASAPWRVTFETQRPVSQKVVLWKLTV